MKKVKIFISFLLFLLFTFSQVKAMRAPKAQDIPVYKKGPHMGTRTIEPRVIVSLDDSNLAVTISKYDGEVKVVVIDDADCVAANKIFVVEGSTSEELELSGLKHGFYSISIELDKVVYCGVFDI